MEAENEPTVISITDIDKCIAMLMNSSGIKCEPCRKCGDEHFPNYGHRVGECDECWFSRFPKEDVQAFYRSFFE